jgi:type I restriction enzyme S subunit
MKQRELSDAIDHISASATTETAARLLEPGAVLIVVRGMILAHTVPSAVLRVPAAINQDMKALVLDQRFLPEYVCAVLWAWNTRLLKLIERSTHDTRKLETERLLEFKIPVLPIVDQQQVLARLAALAGKGSRLVAEGVAVTRELEALMPAVLNRAFRGEL